MFMSNGGGQQSMTTEFESELESELDRLETLLQQANALGAQTNGSSTINVNAGGVGVWIAVTACIAMLGALLVVVVLGGLVLSDLNRQTHELRLKDDTLQAYINIAYGAESSKPDETK